MFNALPSFYTDPITSYSPFANPYVNFPNLNMPTMPTFGFNGPTNYQDAYDWGRNYMANANANSALASAVQTISGLEQQINQVLKLDKLTEAQKERLQAVLNEINAIKEKVNASKNATIEQKQALIAEMNQLQKEAGEIAKKIMEEVAAAADGNPTDGTPTDGTPTDGNPTDGNPTDGTPAGDGVPTIPATVNDPMAQNLSQETQNSVLDICQKIYNGSIGCTGTDYTTILQGTNNITKDNVTAVLNQWQKQFATNSGDKNVIETLFAEEMLWNPELSDRVDGKVPSPKNNVDIIWNITKCLEEKAKELGVYNELIGDFTVAFDELDDTCINQTKVETAVMKINQRVIQAEAAKAAKDKATTAADKAKQEQETKNKEKQDEFLADMREIWKDDELQLSEKVKYENGEFLVRIEGINYYGKDFRELSEKVKKAGYDPKAYLAKQQLQAAA